MKLRRHLRLAFHDWMWDNPRNPRDAFMRRLCWRLPTYFTDPYLDGVPRDPAKLRAWLDSLPEAKVNVPLHPPTLTLSPGLSVVTDSTASVGGGSVVNLRYDPPSAS